MVPHTQEPETTTALVRACGSRPSRLAIATIGIQSTAPNRQTLASPSDRVHEGSLISRLFSRFFDGSLGSELETEELLLHLILAMREVFGVGSHLTTVCSPHRGVRRALEYLRENYAEPVRLTDLAAFARTSSFHLCRNFRSAISVPPHQYLLNVRISRAKEMLEGSGHLGLSAIAQATGFYDQAHFIKSFKKRTGLTPSRYRRLVVARR